MFYFDARNNLNVKNPYLAVMLETNEHFSELRNRIFQLLVVTCITIILTICNITIGAESILRIIPDIQFFQLSPQDFFITSFTSLFNLSLILVYPHLIKSLIFFFCPSLLLNEKKVVFPLLSISLMISIFAILFAFYILAPLTFEFFLKYNADNIEPFWSFSDFSSFLIKILYITLLLFQLPIFQIVLHILNILPANKISKYWKIVTLLAFVISGIVTPSIDPFTQSILALTIYFLYSSGIFFSNTLYPKKFNES